jgi:hypothetical protein
MTKRKRWPGPDEDPEDDYFFIDVDSVWRELLEMIKTSPGFYSVRSATDQLEARGAFPEKLPVAARTHIVRRMFECMTVHGTRGYRTFFEYHQRTGTVRSPSRPRRVPRVADDQPWLVG